MEGAESEPTTGCFKPFLVASLGIPVQMIAGAIFGQSAEMLPQLEDPDSFIPITKDEATWIASTPVIGMIVTAMPAGYLADKFGRLRMVQICELLLGIGFAMIAVAENYAMLLAGRFLLGLGGGFCYSVLLYVGEASPPRYRGSFLAMGPLSSSMGIFLMYVLGAFLPWNVSSAVLSVMALLTFVAAFKFYDTPQWLVQKGRIGEARSSLKRIEHPSNVEARLREILDAATENQKRKENPNGTGSIFEPTVWKPLLMIAGIALLQSWCGFYILCYYTVNFVMEFETSFDPHRLSIFLGAIRIVSTAIASYLNRRTGRRTMGAISGFSSAVFLLIIFAYLQLKHVNPEFAKDYSWIPACSLGMFMLASGIGIFPIPWILPSEVFPLQIRGVMTGFSFALMCLFMFITLKLYVATLDTLGLRGTVLLYTACSMLFGVFSLTALVETHNKPLEEILKEFSRKSRPGLKTEENKDTWSGEGKYSKKEES